MQRQQPMTHTSGVLDCALFPYTQRWAIYRSWGSWSRQIMTWLYRNRCVGMNEAGKRALFERIFPAFPEGRFHWLGGSSSLIIDFPWFSADSSTWLSWRKYGKLLNEQFKTTKAPWLMDGFAALAHNARILSGLEHKYIEELEAKDERIISAAVC